VTEVAKSHRISTSDDVEVGTYLEIAEAEQNAEGATYQLATDH